MPSIRFFLLQTPSTYETRAMRLAGAVMDGYEVISTSFEHLDAHASMLASGEAMPVGSVEFVREAMRVGGIEEPAFVTYPNSLKPWLRRLVNQRKAGEILGRWFVKPVQTKLFSGLVFDTLEDPALLSPESQDRHEGFLTVPADTPVWCSEPVNFVSEWRYYVNAEGTVLGGGRYDEDGEDDAPQPDRTEVEKAALAGSGELGHGFALDMGVLFTGETALVEANDAIATGLYGSVLTPREYAYWLMDRWQKIAVKKTY